MESICLGITQDFDNMTYSEYRAQFRKDETFRKAFGQLTEDEARALIDAERCAIHIKACMMSTWRKAKKELEDEQRKKDEQNG